MVSGSSSGATPQGALGPEKRPRSESAPRTPLTRPPILASEVLREEVAPLEPWSTSMRLWLGAMGAGLVGWGLGHFFRLFRAAPQGLPLSLSLGLGLGLVALLPLRYWMRGVLGLGLGTVLLGLGLTGHGPVGGLVSAHHSWLWEAGRVLGATLLPAALLFRARYRAYRGARIALIAALVLTMPMVVHAGLLLHGGPIGAQVGAGLVLLSVLTSLLGFMGAGTTAASTAWAVLVLGAFAGEVGLRAWWMKGPGAALALQTAVGFFLGATVCALSLFQLLAWAFAKDARQVDVLRNQHSSVPSLEKPE